MSFGDPNNPYSQPQQPQGQPQQPPQQPGYGYPQPGQQAPQGVPPQPGYGYPAAPPVQPYGAGGYPQQPGYGDRPPYAGWWRRFAALLVDGLVIAIPYWILLAIGANLGGGAGSAIAVIGILYGIGLGLFKLYKEGTTGQFIGKKALGISLLREANGLPMGFGMTFVRNLAHFVDSIACYLGWLWPAWDAKKQTFADKICSSVVVKTG